MKTAAPPLTIVDLFAGAGGLSLGARRAAEARGRSLDIRLAVDFEPVAASVYRANFDAHERTHSTSVEEIFDGSIGAPVSMSERRLRPAAGDVDLLVGGPPCQGHSNLNNHTRRTDSKNALYLRMVRAAEVIRPLLLMVENVPSVLSDRHDGKGVVDRAEQHLGSIGYRVAHRVISLSDLGVAQTRRRHVLLATRDDLIEPEAIMDGMTLSPIARDLRSAIGDLADAGSSFLDRRPRPSPENLARMRYLLDNDLYDLPNRLRPPCQRGDHKYRSMYGRLRWDHPAQTITSGYGSIGQGRYMHPDQPRALTAHEAARIQGFPDDFDFSACTTRSALATMIGNAVPPQLSEAIVGSYLRLTAASESDSTRSA